MTGTDPQASAGSTRWLLGRGALAVVASVAANGVTLRAGLELTTLPPIYSPGSPGPVVVPVAASVAATALYALLARRSGRTYRIYARAIGLGLLVSLVPIAVAVVGFRLGLAAVVLLVGMHVAVASTLLCAFVPAIWIEGGVFSG